MDGEEEMDVIHIHDDIDEDIKLLKTVLQDDDANDEIESDGELQIIEQNEDEYVSLHSASRPSTSTDYTASSFPTTSMGTDADDLAYRIEHSSITPETCLAMNRAYQEVLLDTLRNIELSLTENRLKQKQMTDILEQKSKKPLKNVSKSHEFVLRTPFFNDKGDVPPYNADVTQKQQMGDDMAPVRRRTNWTKRVRKCLIKAIGEDALKQILRPILNKLEVESAKMKDCKNDEEIKAHTAKIAELKKEIQIKQQTPPEELLKTVDTDKIDFLRISCVIFNGKLSPGECEGFWRNVLHPSVNREEWTEEEEQMLVKIVKDHNMKHWDKIASELGTNRTPFQCLQHYQLNSLVYDQGEWKPEEDELLLEVVDTVTYGSGKIQWSQVSYYIESRSAIQCQHRWRKINPNSKRGRWENKEDCLLISAVEKYGIVDWSRIATCVPGRSSIQCRDRYLNCIAVGINQWTYEEDKKLLKLYHQYQSFPAVSLYMDRRTEADVEKRYLRLKNWEESWNQFCTLDRDEQESQMACIFKLTKDGTLVSCDYLKTWAEQEKALGKPKAEVDAELRELIQFFEDHEMLRGMEADHWKMMQSTYQIKTDDYLRQEQDRIRNDIIVPRPPPIRSREVYTRYLEQKEKLRKMIENHVDSVVRRFYMQENINNRTLIDSMSLTMRELFEEKEKKKYVEAKTMELIRKGGRKLFTHALTVKNILDILRYNSPVKKESKILKSGDDKKKQANTKNVKKEIWEESSEEEEKDSEENSEDSEDESEEDDIVEEEEVVKSKRAFTPGEISRYKKLQEARRQHKHAMDMIRDVIISKLPSNTVGKKRVFNMFPQNIRDKSKHLGPDDLETEKQKCLTLLMRSFDVDTKKVFKNAKAAKRKHAAHALLMSAIPAGKTRLSKNRSLQNVDSEVMENADALLEVENNFECDDEEEEEDSKQDIKVEPDESVGDINDANDTGPDKSIDVKPKVDLFEFYDRSLPYIPPNLTTLQGLKGFLLQHKCLVDKAGGYFDKDGLREKLYKMKKRGPNLLMNVIGTIRGQALNKAYTSKKQPKLSEDQMRKSFKLIQQTKPYQQLKARFQAAFSWPALLATVATPEFDARVPDSISKIRKVVAVDRESSLLQKKQLEKEAKEAAAAEVLENVENDPEEGLAKTSELLENNSTTREQGRPLNKGKDASLSMETEEASLNEVSEEEADELESILEPKSEAELAQEEDWNIDESIKLVMLMTDGKLVSEEMEEIEINMLVDKILRVFRERRTAKKRPKGNSGKYRKKMSEAMAAAVDTREKIKIMKRLNIYEKYKQIQEEKKEQMEKHTIPQRVDPNAPKKRGRPFGAKSTCYSAPDENTRRSSRQEILRAKAQQMEVYDECGAAPKKRRYVAPRQFDDDYVYTRDEFKECQKIAEKNRKTMEYVYKDRKKSTLGKKTDDVIYIKQEPDWESEHEEIDSQRLLNQNEIANESNGIHTDSNDIATSESITQHNGTETISMAANNETVPMETNVTTNTSGNKAIVSTPSKNNLVTISTNGNTVTASTKQKLASKATKHKTVPTATTTSNQEEVYVATKQVSGFALVPVKSKKFGSTSHFKLVPVDKLKKKEKSKKLAGKTKAKSADTSNPQNGNDINTTEKVTESHLARSTGKKRASDKSANDDGQSKSKKQVTNNRSFTENPGSYTTDSSNQVSAKSLLETADSDRIVIENVVSTHTISHNTPDKAVLEQNKPVPESPNIGNQVKTTEKKARGNSGGKKRATKSPAVSKVAKPVRSEDTSIVDTYLENTQRKQASNDIPNGSVIQSSNTGKASNGDLTDQINIKQSKKNTTTGTSLKSGQVNTSVQHQMTTHSKTMEVFPSDSVSQQSIDIINQSKISKHDSPQSNQTVRKSTEIDMSKTDNKGKRPTETGSQDENSKSSIPVNSSNVSSPKLEIGKQNTSPRGRSVTRSTKESSTTSTQKSSSTSSESSAITESPKSSISNKSPKTSVSSSKSSPVTKPPKSSSVTMSGDAQKQTAIVSDSDQAQNKDPVMVGVPIMVDGVQQTAWLPILKGKDGKLMTDKDGNIVIPKEMAKIRYPGEEDKTQK